MLRSSGKIYDGGVTENGKDWFEYRACINCDVTRVEFYSEQVVQLFPQPVANGLINLSCARVPNEKELADFIKLMEKAASGATEEETKTDDTNGKATDPVVPAGAPKAVEPPAPAPAATSAPTAAPKKAEPPAAPAAPAPKE